MRKICAVVVFALGLCLSPVVHAQNIAQVLSGNGNPPPTCNATFPIYVNLSKNPAKVYACGPSGYTLIGGGAPSGAAGGDLGGTFPDPLVTAIDGTPLAGLATGILKNTTGTGVPSIAIAGDFPTLNQNTTGTAANLSGTPALPNGATGTTQTLTDATTKLATDAFVNGGIAGVCPIAAGIVTCSDPIVTAGGLFANSEFANSTCTTAATIAPANGNMQRITLTAADTCALTFTQPASGTFKLQLKIIQSSSGGFNGLISGGKWPGGSVPTITATSGAVDFISCYLDGTNAYCVPSQNFQ